MLGSESPNDIGATTLTFQQPNCTGKGHAWRLVYHPRGITEPDP